MPLPVSPNVRRQVRLVVHRFCMDRYRNGEGGCDLETELERLFTEGGLERPGEADMRRWVEADEADFDRALLISELLAESGRRIVVPPVAGASAQSPAARPAEPARPTVAARSHEEPEHSARPTGAPSIADLLDGMLAQQARR